MDVRDRWPDDRFHTSRAPRTLLLGGVMALSAVGAAAVLYSLGWLLEKVLVTFPQK